MPVLLTVAIISFLAATGSQVRAADAEEMINCGGHSEEALGREALESDDISKSKAYLKCFPNGAAYLAISRREKMLKEESDCRQALGSSDVARLRSFLQRNSDAVCALDVARRIETLQRLPDFKSYPNSTFLGTALIRGTVGGAAECKRNCGPPRVGCVGFSYETDSKVCTLWSEITGRIPRGQTESGSIEMVDLPSAPRREPDSPRGQFVVKKNYDLVGGTLRSERNSTYPRCQRACAASDQCLGFTYDQSTAICELKDRLERSSVSTGKVSGVKRSLPSAGSSSASGRIYRILANTDLSNYGNRRADYSQRFAESIDRCKLMCEADRRCKAFTFNLPQRACFLKSSFERREAYGGAYSGIKQ